MSQKDALLQQINQKLFEFPSFNQTNSKQDAQNWLKNVESKFKLDLNSFLQVVQFWSVSSLGNFEKSQKMRDASNQPVFEFIFALVEKKSLEGARLVERIKVGRVLG